MSPDEIVRRAALLLRSGAVPVQEFAESLDGNTRIDMRHALTRLLAVEHATNHERPTRVDFEESYVVDRDNVARESRMSSHARTEAWPA